MTYEVGDIITYTDPDTHMISLYMIGYDLASQKKRLIELSDYFVPRKYSNGGRIFMTTIGSLELDGYEKLPFTIRQLGDLIKQKLKELDKS